MNEPYLKIGKLYYVRNSDYMNGTINNKLVCMPYNAPLLCLKVVDKEPENSYDKLDCEFLYGANIFKTHIWKLILESYLKDTPNLPCDIPIITNA